MACHARARSPRYAYASTPREEEGDAYAHAQSRRKDMMLMPAPPDWLFDAAHASTC